jgi:phage/plasmid-like protein (TIGR03299 family)
MPHEVDETTGTALLAFNKQNGTPWHELGEPIDGAFDIDELKARVPGLFFTVEGRPIYFPDSVVDGQPLDEAEFNGVPGWKVIVRTDTNAPLGVTSIRYREFQPLEMFEFGYALTKAGDEDVEPKGDVAGSLLGGRLVFMTYTLTDEAKRLFDFDPSTFERHVVVSGGNDGRHALRAKNTETRVLCHNTYLGHMAGAGREIVIRHTANMGDKVEDAKRVLGLVAKQDEAFIAKMTDLSKRDVDWDSLKAYLNALFPIPNDDKPHTRVENAQNAVHDLYVNSPNLDGVGMNAYRLFQATTEYADHYRNYTSGQGSNADARAVAVLDGAAGDLKDKALALLSKA